MKALLTWTAPALVSGAFIDFLFQWGLGKPLPLLRDGAAVAAGVACMYILVKYRKQL